METYGGKKMNKINKKGASDVFKTIFIGLMVFVLFSSLIIRVAVDFGEEYDHSADEIGGGALNLTLFESSAESVEGNASIYRSNFEGGAVDDIDDPTGIWATLKSLVFMFVTPFTLLASVLVGLGFPEIFVNVVLGILAVTLILAMWSVLRKGD